MRRYLAAAVEHEEYEEFALKANAQGYKTISAAVREACEKWVREE